MAMTDVGVAPSVPLGPPPPVDDELSGPLRAILAELPMPLTSARIADRRARTVSGSLSDAELRRDGAFDVAEFQVPGFRGDARIGLIVCRPTATDRPVPVVYNTHGGGMVAGNHRTIELACELARAQRLQVAVAAVDYRLAPENPDPVPVEDCYAGLTWLAEHAAELGLDPNGIVVSGNSAGGGLAAGLALLARDRGGPSLIGQMLQCPMLDDRCDSPSSTQLASAGLWDGASNRTGWTALLGDRRGTEQVSGYAAPARAADVAGLPPMLIDVGSHEALRDEALTYATRVWHAGGDAELHVWGGAFHSFDEWVPQALVSRAANEVRITWLRRLLNRTHADRPTGG